MRNVSLAIALLAAAASPLLLAQDRNEARLIRKLAGRSEPVRLQTLAQLESNLSLARGSLPQLIAAAQEIATSTGGDELVRPSVVRLISLIGKSDNELAEQALIELLESPHAGIAMVAADTLGANKLQGAIDFLKKQTSREEYSSSYAFRFNLIRSLIQMEHPDAIEFVTAQSRELDGQLKYKIDKFLDSVTEDYFAGEQARFQEWSQSRKSGSMFKQASHQPESLNRIQLVKQRYYGIEIHAKRLMFIIDHSGSMQEYDVGQTRLDRAKGALIRVIEELPGDSEFAIVFYDTDVNAWRDELVLATEQNKRRAISFVRRLSYGSKTNTHGALRRALDFDEDLEAVFLLTDGRPTVGEIIHPNAIVQDILHRNRFRHLNFNTIGIAVEGPTEQFLKTLAAESDGEFRTAN